MCPMKIPEPCSPDQPFRGHGATALFLNRKDWPARLAAWPAGAAHLRPLLHDDLAVATIAPGGRYLTPPPGAPIVFILADDVDKARGPGAFGAVAWHSVFADAGAVMLHSVFPEEWSYQALAIAALSSGKSIIIETAPEFESAWFGLMLEHVAQSYLSIITPDPLRYHLDGGRA